MEKTRKTDRKAIEMRTVPIKVYEYSELSKDAKEVVRDWYVREFHTPYTFYDMVKVDLNVLFGNDCDLDVEFSLGHCQGDGLNVYGRIDANRVIDLMSSARIQYIVKWDDCGLNHDELDELREWCDEYSDIHYNDIGYIDVPQHEYDRYGYSLADQIEFAENWSTELYYHGVDDNANVIGKFEDACRNLFSRINDMYEKMGYDWMYEVSDEELSEELSDMGLEFLENGKVYNG